MTISRETMVGCGLLLAKLDLSGVTTVSFHARECGDVEVVVSDESGASAGITLRNRILCGDISPVVVGAVENRLRFLLDRVRAGVCQ